jgi:hypothetical protein
MPSRTTRVKASRKSRSKRRVKAGSRSHAKAGSRSHAKAGSRSHKRKIFGYIREYMDSKHNISKAVVLKIAQGIEHFLGLSSVPILSFIANAIPNSLYYVFINSIISFLVFDSESVNTLTEAVKSLLMDNFSQLYSTEFKSNIKSDIYTKLTSISKIFVFLYALLEFLTKYNIAPNLFQNMFSYLFSTVLNKMKRYMFANVNVPSIFLFNILMAPFESELLTKSLQLISSKMQKDTKGNIKDPNSIQKLKEYLEVIRKSAQLTVKRYVPDTVQTGIKFLGNIVV